MTNSYEISDDAPSPIDLNHGEGASATQNESEASTTFNNRDEIVALSSWCTAPSGSGCNRCLSACPHEAITLNDQGPEIDEALCTRCGICSGVCDAFAWSRITLEDLAARCEREASLEGSLYFTCNEHLFEGVAPRSNVIILPCLASVPPEFLSYLLAKNLKIAWYLDPSYCQDCSVADQRAPLLFNYAIDLAQTWTGKTIQYASSIPERESVLSLYANIDEGSRRDLLAVLANEGKDIATGKHRQRNAGTIDSFHESQERFRAQGRIKAALQSQNIPDALRQKQAWPRQTLIVKAARELPEKASTLSRYTSTTDYNLCQQSHDCVNACPTGARRINEEGYPVVDPTRCIACGVCISHCSYNACAYLAITAHEYCERTPHGKEA